MTDVEVIQMEALAQRAFTPGAAINKRELFSGRPEQIDAAVSAIVRPGLHAVMYGDRGVGKTSLANVLGAFLPRNDHFNTIKISVTEDSNFSEIWREIFREMQMYLMTRQALVPAYDEVNSVILQIIDQDPPRQITPAEVKFVLSQMPDSVSVIIIIDEFDRMQDLESTRRLADTIKMLSDYSFDVTLIIVAVGDSVADLINAHPSLVRAMVQIPLPRMSDGELNGIVSNGLSRLQMEMEQKLVDQVIGLSQGLPHYTHLLCLEAALYAIQGKRRQITRIDLDHAIKEAVEKTQETTLRSYYDATSRGRLYPTILLGCAHAKKDVRGFFSPAEVGRALVKLTNEPHFEELARFTRHLREFATSKKGSVLQEEGEKGRYRYRFVDPMMPPFILLNDLSTGK